MTPEQLKRYATRKGWQEVDKKDYNIAGAIASSVWLTEDKFIICVDTTGGIRIEDLEGERVLRSSAYPAYATARPNASLTKELEAWRAQRTLND